MEYFLENTNILSINTTNKKFEQLFNNYYLLFVSDETLFDQNQEIIKHFLDSNTIVIDYYEQINEKISRFIIIFEKTLIIIDQTSLILLEKLFSFKSELKIHFLSNSKSIFDENIKIKYIEIVFHSEFTNEVFTLQKQLFSIRQKIHHSIKELSNSIITCISDYLLAKSYDKLNKNRIENYNGLKNSNIEIKEDDFIELRNIGVGALFAVYLAYYVEKEELLLIKKPLFLDNEIPKLFEREKTNYLLLNFPLIPKFYGTIKEKNCLLIEYIKGQPLSNIKDLNLKDNEKITIIFEIMLILDYFHQNHLIYRDLKPNNVIIDDNKIAVLIDFDRMISCNSNINEEQRSIDDTDANVNVEKRTNNFISLFVDPDANLGKISYQNDIYSLGMMIYYIMDEKVLIDKQFNSNDKILKYIRLKNICLKCINKTTGCCISDLINELFYNYNKFIRNDKILDIYEKYLVNSNCFNANQIKIMKSILSNIEDPEAYYYLGSLYKEGKYVNRSIKNSIFCYEKAAAKNHLKAEFALGSIYYEGICCSRDIKKAIHYLTLTAEQNHLESQYILGSIYYEDRYKSHDIEKAIHYLTLAADQNHLESQYLLGSIYYENKYLPRDIKKAFHYFSLAADQNHLQAQLYLGIYYSNCYLSPDDIYKSIHYLELASNQNNKNAQVFLADIYLKGRYIPRDVDKAIHFFSLAAKQNDLNSLYNLGLIYYTNRYIKIDIIKAIYYFQLAADLNHPTAQFILGCIYYENEYVPRDIDKSIHYFKCSADIGDSKAQFYLGTIYFDDQFVKRDIDKAIHYFSLSAKQGDSQAQFNLGQIYEDGEFVHRDINKAIEFYLEAANKNELEAIFNLGLIYYEGNYVPLDIKRSIHYFTISANQNHLQSLFYLGCIYFEGIYVDRDINKAIQYFSIAAHQNHPESLLNLGFIYINRDIKQALNYFKLAAKYNEKNAQYNLGILYYFGKYVNPDIDKSINYLSLAANQNHPIAQFILGFFYFFQYHIKRNIAKGFYLLTQSSKNGYLKAHFVVGYLYHEGKYITRDIIKAIHYYKEGSSLNDQFSKNNLAIIYKNGFNNDVKQNISYSIEYLNEEIKQKNDFLSMYNLARIYFFDKSFKIDKNIIIQLLINSSILGFLPSQDFLCLVLLKFYEFNLEKIELDLQNNFNLPNDLKNNIFKMMKIYKLSDLSEKNRFHESNDLVYDYLFNIIPYKSLINQKNINSERKAIPKINSLFYDGFGEDLIIQ